MNRPIFYCKSWFRAKKRPTEIWTEESARSAHVSRALYSVVVGAPEKPFCFLEINDKFVGVGFLDDRQRESLYYAFKEVEPGRLFLSMATYRDFQGDSDLVEAGTTYIFDQSGAVKIERKSYNPLCKETADSNIDVTGNYAFWPAFGEYDALIEVERAR